MIIRHGSAEVFCASIDQHGLHRVYPYQTNYNRARLVTQLRRSVTRKRRPILSISWEKQFRNVNSLYFAIQFTFYISHNLAQILDFYLVFILHYFFFIFLCYTIILHYFFLKREAIFFIYIEFLLHWKWNWQEIKKILLKSYIYKMWNSIWRFCR